MFAVIKTGGKQYRVAANQTLRIEKLPVAAGDLVTFGEVLMLGDGEKITLGSPLVKGASVAAELVEQTRGPKLTAFKKKRRHGYRRKLGHRQDLSVVRITEILTDGAKPQPLTKKERKSKAPKVEAETLDVETKTAMAAESHVVNDVKLISGVGPALEKKLAAAGVTTLTQIAKFTAADIARIDAELNFKGRIEREEWVAQAKELLAGGAPRAAIDKKAAVDKKPAKSKTAPKKKG